MFRYATLIFSLLIPSITLAQATNEAVYGWNISGLVTISLSTCPSGWAEATELNGKTLVGTLAANGNVGTTGGLDNITPTGTNSAPIFTGNAINFTEILNHTHPATLNLQGGTVAIVTGTHILNSTAVGGSVRAATAGDGVVINNPVGGVASFSKTPTGTVSAPVFTGNSFDNRSAFTKVIFCRKS